MANFYETLTAAQSIVVNAARREAVVAAVDFIELDPARAGALTDTCPLDGVVAEGWHPATEVVALRHTRQGALRVRSLVDPPWEGVSRVDEDGPEDEPPRQRAVVDMRVSRGAYVSTCDAEALLIPDGMGGLAWIPLAESPPWFLPEDLIREDEPDAGDPDSWE